MRCTKDFYFYQSSAFLFYYPGRSPWPLLRACSFCYLLFFFSWAFAWSCSCCSFGWSSPFWLDNLLFFRINIFFAFFLYLFLGTRCPFGWSSPFCLLYLLFFFLFCFSF